MADLFSKLPDTLILVVLSSLPFKDAARTSVLSKRWRRLFHDTATLDFDENNFRKQSSEELGRTLFINFLTDWVRNSTAPALDNFRLAISNPQNNVLQVHDCVRFAVDRKTKNLELDFSETQKALFDLPPCVYQHHFLESLKLFSCNFWASEFKNFTNLRSISLGWIKLPSLSLHSLLSNCEFLENLSLKRCWDLASVSVSAPRIKSLVIDKCSDLEEGGVWINSGTKLRVFKYSGWLVNHIEIEHWRELVEADLDFGLEEELGEPGDTLCEILQSVSSVKALTVCSFMLQGIPSSEEWPLLKPPFYNLKHLTVQTALHPHEYHGISFFLNSSPFLETLTIDIVPARTFQDRGTDLPLQEHEFLSKCAIVYVCVKNSLRVVEVKGFRGGVFEAAVVGYLLMHGSALEKLSIGLMKKEGPKGDDMEEDKYRRNAERLLKFFPRASATLSVSIN